MTNPKLPESVDYTKKAFIDLGTNTFHLLIVEVPSKKIHEKLSDAARLGAGGINQQIITPEAIERATKVLREFKELADQHGIMPENIIATATSAVRNATNGVVFTNRVKQETGISILVISGDEEATLIYEGVQQAIRIDQPSLIVDIGGGSVEFIIANPEGVLWQQSFEIGGQRLMELFMKTDPISAKAIERLNTYFLENLLDLTNAIHQYKPTTLIGSSGSFDSLNAIYQLKEFGTLPPTDVIGFDYPIEAFKAAYEQLVFRNRTERMQIAGMVELRVDMIVVAVCLIRFLIETYRIPSIKISSYALKEGLMNRYA